MIAVALMDRFVMNSMANPDQEELLTKLPELHTLMNELFDYMTSKYKSTEE